MGLTIALHLLVILISIKPSTPTSTSTSTPTPTSTMSDDDSRSYRTVPIFTLKNPMWFRRSLAHHGVKSTAPTPVISISLSALILHTA